MITLTSCSSSSIRLSGMSYPWVDSSELSLELDCNNSELEAMKHKSFPRRAMEISDGVCVEDNEFSSPYNHYNCLLIAESMFKPKRPWPPVYDTTCKNSQGMLKIWGTADNRWNLLVGTPMWPWINTGILPAMKRNTLVGYKESQLCSWGQQPHGHHAGTYVDNLMGDMIMRGESDVRTKSRESMGLTNVPLWAGSNVTKSLWRKHGCQ